MIVVLLDSSGKSLLTSSDAEVIGVTPGQLSDASQTATEFASASGLDPDQVLGEIQAAPPRSFLELLTMDQA